MKKKNQKRNRMLLGLASSILALLLMVTGCGRQYVSYTFNISNGDAVTVKLDTSKGLHMKQENGVFYIRKEQKMEDGSTELMDVAEGDFILTGNGWWEQSILDLKAVSTKIQKETEEEFTVLIEDEVCHLLKIKGTNTGVLLIINALYEDEVYASITISDGGKQSKNAETIKEDVSAYQEGPKGYSENEPIKNEPGYRPEPEGGMLPETETEEFVEENTEPEGESMEEEITETTNGKEGEPSGEDIDFADGMEE